MGAGVVPDSTSAPAAPRRARDRSDFDRAVNRSSQAEATSAIPVNRTRFTPVRIPTMKTTIPATASTSFAVAI